MNKKHKIILIGIFILMFGFLVTESITIKNKNVEIDALRNECQAVQNDLNNKNVMIQDIQTVLDKTANDLKIETENSSMLNEKLNTLIEEMKAVKNELGIANTTITDLKSEEYELLYFGDFKITHYCSERYEHVCGYGHGLTATGTTVTPGRTIAVDPKVIPYGTEVYIEGYGWRVAEDCGGSVKGNHIDVAVNLHSEATDMGMQHGGVWILVKKGS